MDKSQLSVDGTERDLAADLEYIQGAEIQHFNPTLLAEVATRASFGWPSAIRRALAAEAERDDAQAKLNRALVAIRILTGDFRRLADRAENICAGLEREVQHR